MECWRIPSYENRALSSLSYVELTLSITFFRQQPARLFHAAPVGVIERSHPVAAAVSDVRRVLQDLTEDGDRAGPYGVDQYGIAVHVRVVRVRSRVDEEADQLGVATVDRVSKRRPPLCAPPVDIRAGLDQG